MQKDYISLELPKILSQLADLTACEDAREEALARRRMIFSRLQAYFQRPKRRIF